jgi:hypothetical protein
MTSSVSSSVAPSTPQYGINTDQSSIGLNEQVFPRVSADLDGDVVHPKQLQSEALTAVKDDIVTHSMFSERGFVYAVFDKNGKLVSSRWYPAAHLDRVAEGRLAKDATFVEYVRVHSPSTQTCIYIDLPTTSPTCSIVQTIDVLGGEGKLRTYMARDDLHMHRLGAPCKTCCGFCGLKRNDLQRCSVCQKVYYCSKECQQDAWSQHRREHKTLLQKK